MNPKLVWIEMEIHIKPLMESHTFFFFFCHPFTHLVFLSCNFRLFLPKHILSSQNANPAKKKVTIQKTHKIKQNGKRV